LFMKFFFSAPILLDISEVSQEHTNKQRIFLSSCSVDFN
jgi:hypothetical protein